MREAPATRLAEIDDRAAVVDLVVDAFREDPAFRYFFAERIDDEAPPSIASWFDRRSADETVWVTQVGDDVAAVAMWEVVDGAHPAPPATGDESDDAVDPAATTRGRVDRYHAVLNPALPVVPHWYLGILGVADAHRGTGVARAVMTPGVTAAARSGVPAALETTNPDNLARYEHWGWGVTSKVVTDDVPTIWVLEKHP